MTDYRNIKNDLMENVNFAAFKAALDGDAEVSKSTIKLRYSGLMAAIDMFVDFAEKWDKSKDDDERMVVVQDSALSMVSLMEMVAALYAVKDDKEAYNKMLMEQFNGLDAVVCELDMDIAKIAAEMLGMTYDDLIENHWDKHIRCNENGDLELYDEAD